MKASKLLGAGAALLLGGCATVEFVNYPVTSFAEVALKDKAAIKVVATDKSLLPVVNAIKEGFANNGAYSVSESGADYWLVVSGRSAYAVSEPATRAEVVAQENDSSGEDVVVANTVQGESAAKSVSVAVYQVSTLAPVHYFEIPVYGGGEDSKGAAAYEAAFTLEVVERVKDAFLTQSQTVETPIPLEADATLRGLFASSLKEDGSFDFAPFVEAYNNAGAIDLAKACEDIRNDSFDGDADVALGNYYLNLLAQEAGSLDPKVLAKIRKECLMILSHTDAKGLSDAVPVALARIDYKLAHVE